MSIKFSQCEVGATVYLNGEMHPLAKGKIVGPLSGFADQTSVIVEWYNDYITRVFISTLLSEEEGLKENQRLLDEKSRLEKEFEQVEEIVADRLKQAAELLSESNAMAIKHGKSLRDMYDACRPLKNVMNTIGWRTSSWHC